jgi:hypothetical protein
MLKHDVFAISDGEGGGEGLALTKGYCTYPIFSLERRMPHISIRIRKFLLFKLTGFSLQLVCTCPNTTEIVTENYLWVI